MNANSTTITYDKALERATYLVECGFLSGNPHNLAEAMVTNSKGATPQKDESKHTETIKSAPDIFCIQGT